MAAPSLGVDSQIERQMMEFGSGIITDLDRFVMTPYSNCDLDGFELEDDGYGGLHRREVW